MTVSVSDNTAAFGREVEFVEGFWNPKKLGRIVRLGEIRRQSKAASHQSYLVLDGRCGNNESS